MKGHSIVILTDTGLQVCTHDTAGCRHGAHLTCDIPTTLFEDSDWPGLADSIADLVAQHDLPKALTVVVPLNWVFTHLLTSTNSRLTAPSLSFDLEQFLPVPIEELTCSFLPFENGRVLAIAILTAPIAQLLDALKEHGLAVEHLTVDAVAAGLHLQDTDRAIAITDHRWQRTWRGADADPHCAVCVPPPTLSHITQNGPVIDLLGDAATAATGLAAATRATQEQFDLLIDDLAPPGQRAPAHRVLMQCGWCAVVLLCVVAGVFHGHRRALRSHHTHIADAQRACYQTVFDVQDLPLGADLRLASEAKRLENMTRPDASLPTASTSTSLPLDLLRGWAAALPPDIRIDLVHTRVDDKQWTLRGKTASHRDAERLVDVLNGLPGLTARPPRTSRLDAGGVEFSILATVEAGS